VQSAGRKTRKSFFALATQFRRATRSKDLRKRSWCPFIRDHAGTDLPSRARSEYRAADFLILTMERKLSLRFWRVALWGALTFLLFSISFWHFFGASIAVQVGKKETIFSVPPNPFLPSIVSGVLALLCVMLGVAALWWLQSGRKPVPLRYPFASHKGNAELSVRLLLLVLLLAICSSLPTTSRLNTCRACLWTANQATRSSSVFPLRASTIFRMAPGSMRECTR